MTVGRSSEQVFAWLYGCTISVIFVIFRKVDGTKLLFWSWMSDTNTLDLFCKKTTLLLLTISFAVEYIWKLDVVRACTSVLSKHAYLCHIPVSPSHVYVVEEHRPNGFVLYPITLVMHNDDT